MRTERPPEGWLYKAYHGDTLVDLIFRPSGGPIGDEHFERAEEIDVMAQPMLVASLDDVMTTKLLSLTEQEPDFSSVLEFARSLREQIDWDAVRERTGSSPFARAFFTLIEELGIVEPAAVGLEVEGRPGLPPGVGGDRDGAVVDALDARPEAKLVDGERVLELDADLAGAVQLPGRDRLQVGERLLRPGLDQLPRAHRRDLPRGGGAEPLLHDHSREPVAEQLARPPRTPRRRR